jgi:hypothetical protein
MKKVGIVSLLALILGLSVIAYGKDISVNTKADFHDAAVIPGNIKTECTDLGSNFSQSTKKFLEESGWKVALTDSVESRTEGIAVKLEILNAFSSGNAFVGHHKSVTITATLYRDGKVVDTYTATRRSGGGVWAGFKGSCEVLDRCVNTLGNDVAKWVNTK